MFGLLKKFSDRSVRASEIADASPDGGAASADAPETASAAMLPIHEILDLIERDLTAAFASVAESADEVKTETARTGLSLSTIHDQTKDLTTASTSISRDIYTLASTVEQLSSSAQEISRTVSGANECTRSAVIMAHDVRRTIEDWSSASQEIHSIVGEISKIAQKINLLALNATIEAARAGEAGRGFAVVAQEVKDLANASAAVSKDIQGRLNTLTQSTERVIKSVSEVSTTIEMIDPMFSVVSSSVEEQVRSVNELARSASDASSHIDHVTNIARKIDEQTDEAIKRGTLMEAATAKSNGLISVLSSTFVAVLRQSEFGDRRKHDRWPVERALRLQQGSRAVTTTTIDISSDGALIGIPAGAHFEVGSASLELQGIGKSAAEIVAVSHLGAHCVFKDRSEAFGAKVAEAISEMELLNRPLIEHAIAVAGKVEAAFQDGLTSTAISEDELFDIDYQLIPGTSPLQYTVKGIAFLKKVLQPLVETALDMPQRPEFCIAVDRNGYIPVHNVKYSHAQKPGEVAWNTRYSRNQRIFNDRTGITAARNIRRYHIQNYKRDMGNGEIVLMKEIDCPIKVNGRHWGGVRLAFAI